ncbi:MAG: glycosyltransferase family 2 protein [Gelidibacter sp.]
MVSIIIPYYNRPEKIRRCLSSVLEQTYQNFEIIVIDDHSSIPLTVNNDPRIKVFRNQKNLGPGLSRNVGLDNAKGEYIAFLDSDDHWNAHFLHKCLKQFKLAKNNPGMVFTNTFSVTTDGVIPKRKWDLQTETILPNILITNRRWATSSCLWKANIIKDVKWISSRNWEDYAFDVSVALKCNKVSQIDEFLVFYDAEGLDKLSKQKYEEIIVSKSKSILQVSKTLIHSNFSTDLQVKEAITRQLINNIIAIIETRLKDHNLIWLIINELKKWNGFKMGLYLKLIIYFPVNIQLRFLRRLKA